jgi:DUF917 family protein
MLSKDNQKIYEELNDQELILRVARECIVKIDGNGGIWSRPGGAEMVIKRMLKEIRKQKQKNIKQVVTFISDNEKSY